MISLGLDGTETAKITFDSVQVIEGRMVVGGVRRLGTSWLAEEPGILVGRFAGAPYDLGLAFGRLTRPWIRSQETHLDEFFKVLIPGGLKRSLIRHLSAFRLRRLPDEIPDDLLLAIAGLADGYEPVPPASGWNAWTYINYIGPAQLFPSKHTWKAWPWL